MREEDAIREGYTIDKHCYPWQAYKGPRFNPTESLDVVPTLPSAQEQALKHFDELLTRAQEVVNNADLEENIGNSALVYLVDVATLRALKALIQKISDEAVEIIKQVQKEGRQ